MRLATGCCLVLAGLCACSKSEEPAAPVPDAAAVQVPDAGPRWRVFVVQNDLTRPLGPDTGALKTPVTFKAWLPGADATRLSAKAVPVGSTSKLQLEFSAAGADAGSVAQATLAETPTAGKVDVQWLSANADGGLDVVASSEIELAGAPKAEPEAAPAKPAKGKAAKAQKSSKKNKKKKH